MKEGKSKVAALNAASQQCYRRGTELQYPSSPLLGATHILQTPYKIKHTLKTVSLVRTVAITGSHAISFSPNAKSIPLPCRMRQR